MDYEQKYKEALKRADSLTEKYGGRDLAEYIFPELAESEDERIRKAIVGLIEELQRSDKHFGGVELTDMLAYLEKQKERGPLTKEEEYILHRIIEYLEDETCPSEWISLLHDIYCLPYEKQKEPHYTKRNALFDKCVENCEPEVMKKVSDEVDEMLGKEQKPTEWNANDKAFIKDCARILDENGYVASAERLLSMFEQKSAEHGAKGRRGRIGTTPEHIRKKAENFLSKMEPPYDGDDICSAYETGAMENANPSWSEEDEDFINMLILHFNYLIDKGGDSVETYKSYREKLKSLRPSWKPSEEQDYSDLSDLERAIHRGFLCAGVENVPVAIIKETAKEVQSTSKAEG